MQRRGCDNNIVQSRRIVLLFAINDIIVCRHLAATGRIRPAGSKPCWSLTGLTRSYIYKDTNENERRLKVSSNVRLRLIIHHIHTGTRTQRHAHTRIDTHKHTHTRLRCTVGLIVSSHLCYMIYIYFIVSCHLLLDNDLVTII